MNQFYQPLDRGFFIHNLSAAFIYEANWENNNNNKKNSDYFVGLK